MAARPEIRQFISLLRPTLERAQSQGTLARTKLDVRDQFQSSIVTEDGTTTATSMLTFNEELEAFCADMRLAGVTVQQQVERHTRRWGRGLLFGFFGALIMVVVGFMFAGGGSAGLGAVLLFLGTPITFILLLIVGSNPIE